MCIRDSITPTQNYNMRPQSRVDWAGLSDGTNSSNPTLPVNNWQLFSPFSSLHKNRPPPWWKIYFPFFHHNIWILGHIRTTPDWRVSPHHVKIGHACLVWWMFSVAHILTYPAELTIDQISKLMKGARQGQRMFHGKGMIFRKVQVPLDVNQGRL